eukprot:10672621-Lingulodinium_polyedra.AAC.1
MDLKTMPEQGWTELRQLLHEAEQQLTMPLQEYCTTMTLRGKPSGGERTVGQLGMLVRIWTRARKHAL